MSTTSSKNFTTLYSGSGSVTPQGAYGNANVVSLLAAGTDGANTVTTISATGNITTDAYFVGNFAGNITGNISVPGSNTQVLFNNSGNVGAAAGFTFNSSSNVLATPGTITAVGNVTAPYFLGNGSQLTGLPATYGNANVANFLANYGSNTISTTGNITGGNVIGTYLWGDGGNITGVVAGSETIQIPVKNTSGGTLVKGTPVYATGTVGATDVLEVSASRADTAATMPCVGILETTLGINATGYVISIGHLGSFDTSTYTVGQTLYVGATGGLTATRPGNGYLVQPIGTVGRVNASTGAVEVNSWNYFQLPNLGAGNIWLGNASSVPVETTLATYTGNIGAGNINISGAVSAAGNVTGNYILGNGSQLSGLPATYGNANVAAFLAAFGSNTIVTTGNISGGNISATGNVTGANVNISGSGINLPGGFINATTHVAFAGAGMAFGSYNTGNTSGNALVYADGANGTVQIYSPPTGNDGWVFNSGTGNLTLPGNTSAINYANGVNILTSATGTYGDANVATFLAAFGSNTVSTTGNVTSGNLITTGTISATAATANVLLSNIRITAQNVNSGQQYTAVNARALSATTDTGRMLFGNGFQGNVSTGVDFFSRQAKARFGFWDTAQVPASYAASGVNMASTAQYQLTGNTASGARLFSGVNYTLVASEGTGNTFTSAGTVPAAVAGFNTFAVAGNWVGNTTGGMANVGNVIVNTASGGVFGTITYGGSTMGNSFGIVSTNQSTAAAGTTTTVSNQIYYSAWDSITAAGTFASPGNVFVYHNPGVTNSYGVNHSNVMRASTNYYFLRNDDDVAQAKLGSLRSYHEYQYTTATSGTVNIDKTNSQVQFIAPTANVTIGDFQNFVTTANDGTNNDSQADTVTLIIQQGATPYTVTMPTGNAAIKYASNVSTIGNTANSVTMVSITAFRSSANAAIYLATVSPEFV